MKVVLVAAIVLIGIILADAQSCDRTAFAALVSVW